MACFCYLCAHENEQGLAGEEAGYGGVWRLLCYLDLLLGRQFTGQGIAQLWLVLVN
jgi:hypothetical protein